MECTFIPKGICPTQITFNLNNNIITNINFKGGCSGNLQAISIFLNGMTADQIIEKAQGICCGKKGTSCSDQLAKAISKALDDNEC